MFIESILYTFSRDKANNWMPWFTIIFMWCILNCIPKIGPCRDILRGSGRNKKRVTWVAAGEDSTRSQKCLSSLCTALIQNNHKLYNCLSVCCIVCVYVCARVLTCARRSKRAKSSLSIRTSSWAESVVERLVKPFTSAKRILHKHTHTDYYNNQNYFFKQKHFSLYCSGHKNHLDTFAHSNQREKSIWWTCFTKFYDQKSVQYSNSQFDYKPKYIVLKLGT